MTTKFRSRFGKVPERLFRDTRGVTLVVVALTLTALVGFAGILHLRNLRRESWQILVHLFRT